MTRKALKAAVASAALLTLALALGPGGSQIAPPAEAKSTRDAGYAACFDWCSAHRSGVEKTKCECNCNIYYIGRRLAKNMLSCVALRDRS